jgi:hypothetical protein
LDPYDRERLHPPLPQPEFEPDDPQLDPLHDGSLEPHDDPVHPPVCSGIMDEEVVVIAAPHPLDPHPEFIVSVAMAAYAVLEVEVAVAIAAGIDHVIVHCENQPISEFDSISKGGNGNLRSSGSSLGRFLGRFA